MSRLSQIKARVEAATEGPWLEREDFDYYQGGTYIGAVPQRYVPNPNGTGNILTDCDISQVEYFKTDVCRIEADNNLELLKHARADVPYLLAVIESQAKEIEALRAAVGEAGTVECAEYGDKNTPLTEADAIVKARQELKR